MATETLAHSRALCDLVNEPGSGRYGETLPGLCAPHRGKHWHYLGGCFSLPPHDHRHPPRRSRRAPPEPTVRVVVDNADELGEAIAEGVVLGFRRARDEQRQERGR